MKKYTPEIINSYAKMLVSLSTCPICGTRMLKKTRKEARRIGDLFPAYYRLDLKSQMQRANITFCSEVTDRDHLTICEQCAKEGLSTFICSLCKVERSSDLIQEYYGDPPDYLCKICYETVPAKVWEEKSEQLYERHKYDYE